MSSKKYEPAKSQQSSGCQACGFTELEKVLDLGYQPLCNEFWPATDAARPQTYYPLCLVHCPKCSLVQLDFVIPTDYAFGDQYTYVTGSSKSLVNYYSDLATRLVEKYDLRPGDAVVEIGSNDGTLLKAFQSHGLEVLGIEGATQSAALALEAGVPTLVQFFGSGTSLQVRNNLPDKAKIRLIFAMNVLAHTDNINDFLPEVGALMDPGTVFVSQSHWLVELVRKFEFDTIYHEHLRYYTVGSLMRLFESHGLSMTDVETNDFYGGSILCYAERGFPIQSDQLRSVLKQEEELDVVQSLKDMKQVLLSNKAQLINLLVGFKKSGKKTVGIGAPMKASTLLNFYGITPDLVEYIAEVNPLKIGTVVPGVRIPVVHEEVLFKDQPEYALLLTWNMAKDIIPKLRSLGYKGKFIMPVPNLEVID